VSAAELPLHVRELGPSPGSGVDTFLLLHGYAGSSFTWRYWAPRLAERGHVMLVDLKGFGRAPKPADSAYGPLDQAALVARLIEQRDLRHLTLMGHSLGGGVALVTARGLVRDGDGRLDRLVLVAAAAYDQRMPPFMKLADHPRLSSLLMGALSTRMVVRSVLRSIVYDPSRVDDAQVRGYAAPLQSPGAVRALIECARQLLPEDLEALVATYPEIDVPTLLLWGREDPVVPLAIGQRLSRELPNAHLQVLDACGHLPAEERPDTSFAALEAFLDDGSAPTRSLRG